MGKTHARLIRDARRGKEAAFLRLVDEHQLPLFRFAWRLPAPRPTPRTSYRVFPGIAAAGFGLRFSARHVKRALVGLPSAKGADAMNDAELNRWLDT